MPRLLKKNDTGDYYVQEDNGMLRPAMAEDIANSQVVNYNEMGVTGTERFVIKNFAANPSAAQSYLRKRGYQVIPIGNSFNFAVRRPGEEEFKVLDPKGFGKGGSDFLYDMLDFVADVGTGILTGATATAAGIATGGVGAIAGAGVGGAASELARQQIGEALGLEGNLNPTMAGVVGGLSAGVPIAGKAIGSVVRPVARAAGEIGESLLGRVTGMRPLAGHSMTDTIKAWRQFVAQTEFKTPGEALQAIRRRLADLTEKRWAEQVEVGDILLKHGGRNVNISPFKQAMQGLRKIDEMTLFDEVARNKGRAVLQEIESLVGPIGFTQQRGAGGRFVPRVQKVSLEVAERIRETMAEFVDSVHGWKGTPKNVSKKWIGNFRGAYGQLRSEMSSTLKGAGVQERYDILMGRIHDKLNAKSFMRKEFGLSPDDVANKTAERRITAAFTKGTELYQQDLRNFDRLFGDDWYSVLRMMSSASMVNPNPAAFGRPGIMPPFTATGGIFGASAIGGGALIGGAPGALAGAALASPKVALGAQGMLHAAGTGISSVATSKATRDAITTALQTAAREQGLFPTARETHKPVVRLR